MCCGYGGMHITPDFPRCLGIDRLAFILEIDRYTLGKPIQSSNHSSAGLGIIRDLFIRNHAGKWDAINNSRTICRSIS